MKKLIYSILLAFLLAGNGVAFSYSNDGNDHLIEGPGGPASDPVRVYSLVRYADQGPNRPSLSAGDVVIWNCVSDDGVTVALVGDGAGSADAVAGVVVSPTIPTDDQAGAGFTASQELGRRNWGYIQKYGLCTVVNFSLGSAVVGSGIKAGDIPRTATAATMTDIQGANLGFAYDASSNGQSEAFIKTR